MTPPVQTQQLTEERELDDAEFLRWVAGWLDRIDPILQAVFSREAIVPDEDERRRMVEFLQGTSAQDRLRALADAYLAQQRVIEAAQWIVDNAFVNAHTDGGLTVEFEASAWTALREALAVVSCWVT